MLSNTIIPIPQSLSTKQIRQILASPNNEPLLNFIRQFFINLKAANPDRKEHDHTEDDRVLDIMARLLVGDEVCAAVAFSGEQLLLATNKHNHFEDHVSLTKKIIILGTEPPIDHLKQNKIMPMRFGVRYVGYLQYNNESPVRAESNAVTFQWTAAEQRYKKISGDSKVIFSKASHNIPFIDADISYTISEDRNFDININIGEEYSHANDMPYELNPFRRRIAFLIDHLAFIARAVLRPDLTQYALDHVWQGRPRFLMNSLSYELAPLYPNNIKPYEFSHNGMNQLSDFYEWLVKDYEKHKNVDSVTTWTQTVADTIQNIDAAPAFIKTNPDTFIKIGLPYFLDLIRLEKYVEESARKKDKLAKILVQERLFKKKVSPRVIGIPTDVENLHAEMRLLEVHLREQPNAPYFGITKLCCGFCTYAMQQFDVVEYRGSSATLWPTWVVSDLLMSNAHRSTFLGDTLAQLYSDMAINYVSLPGAKSGEVVPMQRVLQLVLPKIGSINQMLLADCKLLDGKIIAGNWSIALQIPPEQLLFLPGTVDLKPVDPVEMAHNVETTDGSVNIAGAFFNQGGLEMIPGVTVGNQAQPPAPILDPNNSNC